MIVCLCGCMYAIWAMRKFYFHFISNMYIALPGRNIDYNAEWIAIARHLYFTHTIESVGSLYLNINFLIVDIHQSMFSSGKISNFAFNDRRWRSGLWKFSFVQMRHTTCTFTLITGDSVNLFKMAKAFLKRIVVVGLLLETYTSCHISINKNGNDVTGIRQWKSERGIRVV